MKNSTKIILVALALVVVVVAAYELTHQVKSSVVGAISPAGTTNSTSVFLSQTMSLATSAGTTTSVFNNTGYDVAMRSVDIMCQGVGTSKTAFTGTGLANLNFKISTSSTNYTSGQASDINTNYLGNVNIGTSTVDDYIASTTEGVIQGTSRILPNGTYALITANATNTAACSIGINGFRL